MNKKEIGGRQRKRRVVLAGYFGAGNIGDEAILYSIIGNLLPLFEIYVMTVGDSRISKFKDQIKYCRLPNLRNLNNMCFLKFLFRADALLLGGGGFLANKLQPSSIYYWMFLVIIAKILHKRVIILGTGCGPFANGFSKPLVKFLFEIIDFIFVRDSISERNLRNLGIKKQIHVISDLAFLLNPDTESPKPPNDHISKSFPRPQVLFVLPRRFHEFKIWKSDRFARKYEDYVHSFSDLADYIVSKFEGTPIFYPFSTDDLELYRDIRKSMIFKDKSIIVDDLDRTNIDFGPVFSQFRSADIVIAGRYHSFIFSILSEKLAIPLPYHPKYYDLVSVADVLNISIQVGDGIEWEDLDLDLTKAKNSLDLLFQDSQEYLRKIKQTRSELSSNARFGITSVCKILSQ